MQSAIASAAVEREVVLLVEDDPDIRACIGELLEGDGFTVAVASHGADALAQLERGLRPAVIVLDLMMPVMDGWTLLARLRADVRFADLPAIVVSASSPAPRAFAVLEKPFDMERLNRAVRACCQARREAPRH